jgi:hypothetical protein
VPASAWQGAPIAGVGVCTRCGGLHNHVLATCRTCTAELEALADGALMAQLPL